VKKKYGHAAVESEMRMIRHLCIESEGQHARCSDCPISKRGFCHKFRTVLTRIAKNAAHRYAGISPEDREDIFTATVESVLRRIDQFEGRHGAKFSAWVWQIYRNKIIDHFRGKNSLCLMEEIREDSEWHDPSEETERKIAISECFKKHLPNDKTGCIRLYLNLYKSFQKGKNRKALAETYDISPNTLNQRIKRCRVSIRRLFRKCLDDDGV